MDDRLEILNVRGSDERSEILKVMWKVRTNRNTQG